LKEEELIEPHEPQSIGLLSNSDVVLGVPIPPIDRLKVISAENFEDIIREWIAGYCKTKYIKVRKPAGAGDKGRDVIAFINNEGDWDNYQCKHYDHPLHPGDIWLELGKLCYYTFNKHYNLPLKYYFVSPQGVGNTLGDLLDDPKKLKEELIVKWEEKCRTRITSTQNVELTAELKEYIKSIDFSIFTSLDPQELIEQHKKTRYFASRFGGGLQKRNRPLIKIFEDKEYSLRFIEQLFEAYSDHIKTPINKLEDLKHYNDYFEHFNRNRNCFYWAEALNQFSRDHLPPNNNCFEDLKEEVYFGVVDICNGMHSSGYENVLKTTNEATKLTLNGNALLEKAQIQDKIGICHHLANENKLKWVKK
tara:strand:+ start:331 stop:1419 length:1089 start_codon:yes stop_codon:yes gene_type:complete